MSRLDDYEDIDMDGLEPWMYSRIPAEINQNVHDARGGYEPIRVIWNGKLDQPTVLVKSPGTATEWHDGFYLRGWAILMHWDQPLGDGSGIVDYIANMVSMLDHRNDREAAEKELTRRIDESAAKVEVEEDQRSDDFVEDRFPKTYLEEVAFNRDVEKWDEVRWDIASGSKAFKRALPKAKGGNSGLWLPSHLVGGAE